MPSTPRIIECHTFCTGIDHPAFISVSIAHDHSTAIDDIHQAAGRARCQLKIDSDGIFFYRNDERLASEGLIISAEHIPQSVRDRIDCAGGPLDARDPSTPELAMRGAQDGSRVISSDELERGDFQSEWLADEVMCRLLSRADHIAYEVYPDL